MRLVVAATERESQDRQFKMPLKAVRHPPFRHRDVVVSTQRETIRMAGCEVSEEAVSQVLYAVIAEINEELSHDKQLGTDPSSMIYGDAGTLDSLDLVRLVVLLEQQISEKFDIALTIADERAMSEANSRFHSVGTLVAHVMKLISEDTAAT
jgi:acyl carrier protein